MRKVLVLTLVFAVLLGTVALIHAGEKEKNVCPKCGKTTEPGWKFCPWDGTALFRTCPKCNRTFPGTHKFCPQDGTRLEPEDAGAEKALKPEPEKDERDKEKTPAKQDKDKKKPGTLKVEKLKENTSSTAFEILKGRLADPDTAGRNILKAVREKDRRFLDTAILWASYSEFFQKGLKDEERLLVERFKKAFLDDLLSEKPAGLAKEFDMDLKDKVFQIKNIRILSSVATIVFYVTAEKTVEQTHRVTFNMKLVGDLWLATGMSVYEVSKKEKE